MARTFGIAMPILALAAAGLMVASGPASAVYMVTPLTLRFSQDEAQVGDEITISVGPNAEDPNATQYAGRQLSVQYGWNPNENEERDPEQPTSDADEVSGNVGVVQLDENVEGSLTWTIPAEADDHNVFFRVIGPGDELLASGHVRVGDAPPVMAILAGSGPSEVGEPLPPEPEGESASDEKSAVPAPGLLAVAVGVGALALALRRR